MTDQEPTTPGWYASADPLTRMYMVYLRLPDIDVPDVIERKGQWMVFTADGDGGLCDWGYIAQAGPVTSLVRQEVAAE